MPQLSGGWGHNYSTETRQAGHANEQPILFSYVYDLFKTFYDNFSTYVTYGHENVYLNPRLHEQPKSDPIAQNRTER